MTPNRTLIRGSARNQSEERKGVTRKEKSTIELPCKATESPIGLRGVEERRGSGLRKGNEGRKNRSVLKSKVGQNRGVTTTATLLLEANGPQREVKCNVQDSQIQRETSEIEQISNFRTLKSHRSSVSPSLMLVKGAAYGEIELKITRRNIVEHKWEGAKKKKELSDRKVRWIAIGSSQSRV